MAAAYQLLAAMLSDAVLEGVMPASPCREVDLPKVVKPAPRWLTRHEYDRIQMALADHPQAVTWQAFVALGCFCGLRPGELAGLDVEHLDFERGMVFVSQVVTRHGMKPYGKTSSSTRWVPFPREVADLLWRLVGDRASGPVFTAAEGGRVNDRNFARRVWDPALQAAGIEPCRPYVLRHTAASWLVQAGVPDYEVASLLGHSSTRMLTTYGHLNPERHERVRAAWASDAANGAQVAHAGASESV